jgi:pimeloyl-ACP methyl ester carboxylesterase
MTKYRSDEILGAVETMVSLNDKNIPELMAVGLDFKGKLNTNEIHYMGHSFGGAAAFHAAHRRVPTSVIAHDVSIPESLVMRLLERDSALISFLFYVACDGLDSR